MAQMTTMPACLPEQYILFMYYLKVAVPKFREFGMHFL